jgi:ABC-type Na+ efflux pump permease subunit
MLPGKLKQERKMQQETRSQKVLGSLGLTSAGLGIVSLHNVCHLVCEGAIVALALIGITVVGMPLAFLQEYTLLFAIMGIISSAIGISFYLLARSHHRMTKKNKFWFVVNIVVLVASIVSIGGII